MIITLNHPVSVGGDWDDQFFDTIHNHLLCLFENKIFLLSLDDVNPRPIEFYQITNLSIKIKLLKLSLNKELLAIQVTNTSIFVLDTRSEKRWRVDIRGNTILEKGIIWSEHGGNSEDLVIVTNKGIELYKVNNRKGYCKLSRYLPQPVLNYWYNNDTRMILLATSKKTMNSSSTLGPTALSKSNKELLVMDGYFLKVDKAGIPMLELPPPDKIPRFELGPGVEMNCIHLVNVYGKLLTLVRYVLDELAYFAVYQMMKSSVDKLFSLALGNMSQQIVISTYDNLIICHDLKAKNSLIFDVQKTPRERQSRASSIIIDPIAPPSVVSETSRFIEEEIARAKHRSKRSLSVTSTVSVKDEQVDDPNSGIDGNDLAHGIPQIKRAESIKFLNSTEDLGEFEPDLESSRLNVDIKNSRFDYVEIEGEPRPCYPFYGEEIFDWYEPSIAYDINNKVLWKIQCTFESTAKLIEDYREKILFLQRRGRKYYYLKPVMTNANGTNGMNNLTSTNIITNKVTSSVSHESQASKISILRILYDALEEKVNRNYYSSLFFGMNNSYVLESYRYLTFIKGLKIISMNEVDVDMTDFLHLKYLINTDVFNPPNNNNTNNNGNAGNGNSTGITDNSHNNANSNSNTAVIKTIIPSVRRQSMGEKVLQRVMNRNRNDSLIVLDVDSPLDIEPLEPNDQTISQPIISIINIITNQAKKYADVLTGFATMSLTKEKLIHQISLDPFPLNTRRDEKGDLIINQTEVLIYVWIPIFVENQIDYYYCCDILTDYISSIIDQGITMIPSIFYLHLQLLFALKKYQDILNYLAMNYYPNSIYIARSLLDFATLLQEEVDSGNVCERNNNKKNNSEGLPVTDGCIHQSGEEEEEERKENDVNDLQNLQLECIRIFRIDAVAMLWKLGEYSTIVKTYLLQGMILEAIEVCQQFLQYGSATLPSSATGNDDSNYRPTIAITGTEFFIATIQLLEEEQRALSNQKNGKIIFRSMDERIRLLYAVYSFISVWDKTLLERTKDNPSRLTQFALFPETVFEPNITQEFKRMFGYSVE